MVSLGPVALFKEAKLNTNFNKLLEKIEKLQTASLKYKLSSSSAGTSKLLYGFDVGLMFVNYKKHKIEKLAKNKQRISKVFLTEYVHTISMVLLTKIKLHTDSDLLLLSNVLKAIMVFLEIQHSHKEKFL